MLAIDEPATTPEAVLAAAKQMLADGLVEGTSGNISGRLDDGTVCLTPSSVAYETMTLDDLVVVDLDGDGRRRHRSPTTEKDLHLSVLRAYPEIGAVIHTHAVYATMFALAHEPIPAVIEEVVVYLGGDIPCCDYKGTGTQGARRRGGRRSWSTAAPPCSPTTASSRARPPRPRRCTTPPSPSGPPRSCGATRAMGATDPPAARQGEHRHGRRLQVPAREPVAAGARVGWHAGTVLADQIQSDLTTAMKARDELRVATLRVALAAMKEAAVAGKEAKVLDDDAVRTVLTREVKRREEAAEAFRAGAATIAPTASWRSGRCSPGTCPRR